MNSNGLLLDELKRKGGKAENPVLSLCMSKRHARFVILYWISIFEVAFLRLLFNISLILLVC